MDDGITVAVLTNTATSDDDDIASDVVDDCGNLSHRFDDADDSDDAEDEEDDPGSSTHDIHDGISNAVRLNAAIADSGGSYRRRRFAHSHPSNPPRKSPRLL